MFSKCIYVYGLIEKLDISEKDKFNLELEINHLVNLLMFGNEQRPVSISSFLESERQ